MIYDDMLWHNIYFWPSIRLRIGGVFQYGNSVSFGFGKIALIISLMTSFSSIFYVLFLQHQLFIDVDLKVVLEISYLFHSLFSPLFLLLYIWHISSILSVRLLLKFFISVNHIYTYVFIFIFWDSYFKVYFPGTFWHLQFPF